MLSRTILTAVFSLVLSSTASAVEPQPEPIPDLTKTILPDTKKDYHLGPIGARGWMYVKGVRLTPQDYTWDQSTAFARQILVTLVEKGSPADGVLAVGDVILGVGDKLFDSDPRMTLAKAINEAEKTENEGKLKLLRWRPDEPDKKDGTTRVAGKQEVVYLNLATLGTYSDTAPYDCPKSEAIYKQTLDAVYRDELNGKLGLWALALLATGEPKHVEKVKAHIQKIAKPGFKHGVDAVEKGHAWNWGYQLILLCEYHLMTGDKSVLPAIKELAVALSMGQSNSGTWGHHMARPSYNDGRMHSRLSGYAALNQPSLTCYMGLVFAEKCGVRHPEITQALEKSTVFFGHYIDKGAIPYGYGKPVEYVLSNNGTSGTAAITFSLKGDKKGASFFSKLCGPAAGKVEIGHTGAFFNSMWTGLGANVSGPKLSSSYFKEWTLLRTMTRRWNGGYVYQNAGGGANSYRGLGASSAMLLHFCLPRRKIYITGKDQDESIWLNAPEAKAIANIRRIDYAGKTNDELLGLLGNEMPLVRRRASDSLATRDGNFVDELRSMLKGTRHQKIGACHALSKLKEKSAPAMDDLLVIIRDKKEELWVRNCALDALSRIGEPARKHVPELLKMLVGDIPEDKRRHLELNLAWAITTLAEKPYTETQDKALVYAAAKKLLGHPRMRARIEGMKLIDAIGLDDFHIFADQIVHVIRNQDPNYATYHNDRPSQFGLSILDRLNVKEGIDLCIDTIYPGIWGQKYRIGGKTGRLEQLKKYGAGAKPYLPRLKSMKVGGMEDVIKAIESSNENRTFITLEEAKKAGKM